MKKRFYSLVLLCFAYSISYCQQVSIPDSNFANWLNINFPSCMDGNLMDTQCAAIVDATEINISDEDVSDLTGLEYFVNLTELDASENLLTELPPLAENGLLEILDLSQNLMTSVNNLPESLIRLKLNQNNNLVEILDNFPAQLEYLDISNCSEIAAIPEVFPITLETLIISNCTSLYEIPSLPVSLGQFYRNSTPQLPLQDFPVGLYHLELETCGLNELPSDLPLTLNTLKLNNNPLGNQSYAFLEGLDDLRIGNTNTSELVSLPPELAGLDASNNQLTSLTDLPESLIILLVEQNPLITLDLPENISWVSAFDCPIESISPDYLPFLVNFSISNTPIESIPQMNEEMAWLSIENTNISCFSWLPQVSNVFILEDNPATCIPFIPEFNMTGDEDPLEMSICQENDIENNPNNCPSLSGIEGYVYLDQDLNCDFNEGTLSNIPIKLSQDGFGNSTTTSLANGRYMFSTNLGLYDIGINTLQLPFAFDCEESGLIQDLNLDSANPYLEDVNLALRCKDENDFGVAGLVIQDWVFPGENHFLKAVAGEFAQFYGAYCAEPTSGEVIIEISGPAIIEYALSEPQPSLITDNTAVYEMEDITDFNFLEGLNLYMYTLTTATDEDEICVQITVNTSSLDDPNLDNNYVNWCYPVVNSYDPNNKLVSPMTVDLGFQDWMYYTINFQNTGSAPAFNIRLEDELPANLNLETFQMINASHNSSYEIIDRDLTVYFPDIMLADSTTNEAESKGYFQFKAMPLTPMEANETIENSASIYFDFNEPIITNTAVTEVVLPDGVREFYSPHVYLYPNPSKGEFTVNTKSEILSIKCFDLLGKEIEVDFTLDKFKSYITLQHANIGIYMLEVATTNGNSSIRFSVK